MMVSHGGVCVPVSERHDALFIVGSLDETLELRGLRYHPIDIETSVQRAHRGIGERYESPAREAWPAHYRHAPFVYIDLWC